MFRVGQRVVCIKRGRWVDLSNDEVGPSYRQVYTIRTINFDDGDTFLRFEEIRNPRTDDYVDPDDPIPEAIFWAVHFRPLNERKTDISIFTAMLNPNKQKAPA